MAMNSQAIAQKWAQNLGRSTQAITDGVNAVTVNPAQSAIAAIPRYLQGVQDSVNSGKMARSLGRVTLQSWQQSMKDKGIPRIASGATAAIPKMAGFMDKFIPHLQAGLTKLASTPRSDLNTNIQRSVMMMQHNATFQYNK